MAHPADIEKPADVALYLFDLKIDGKRYGGEVPAKSWEEAQSMVQKFGGTVIGRAVEVHEDTICSICSGDMVRDKEHPKPSDEDFPELIDD
jgi:hypothetical protein